MLLWRALATNFLGWHIAEKKGRAEASSSASLLLTRKRIIR